MTTISIDLQAFNEKLQSIEQLLASGELKPAAEQLNELARTAPQHPAIYMLGMRLGEAAGNGEAALKSARHAVACAPGWPVAVAELAACLARQNKMPEALAEAKRAVDLGPNDISVLRRAIDVANHGRESAIALPWIKKASALAPTDPMLQRMLARALADTGAPDEAITVLDDALQIENAPIELLAERMTIHFNAGHAADAKRDSARLLELQPDNESFRFWRDKTHGNVPTTQPRAMVEGLFDNYAPTFDMHLVRGLQYDTPKKVAEWIKEHYPTLELNILDLGCGTGLLGVFLGPIKGAMIGVDLSEKMIEQAARHKLYHRFHRVNLVDALENTPPSLYHVITANDVLIYVGDLSAVIPNAWKVLRADGNFIFTCETAPEDGPDMVLDDKLRYRHKASAVEAMCREAGYDKVELENVTLRMENGKPIEGFRVIAHKAASGRRHGRRKTTAA
jgi:predicted TPR repeat methyltransferase